VNVTADVMHALRRDLFPPHQYVWATEVTIPSHETHRRMDAAAVNTAVHPFYVDGFEVKVSRGDWLNDRRGDKSTPARRAADRFWFVFGSPTIYEAGEVPEDCGIIHIEEGKAFEVRAAASPRESVTTYCRALLSTILTRTLRETPADFVQQVDRVAEERGFRKGQNAAKRASSTTRAPTRAARNKHTPSPVAPGSTRRAANRPKYDPGRYNFDDGLPLDLP
jgi:hypothetical protein